VFITARPMCVFITAVPYKTVRGRCTRIFGEKMFVTIHRHHVMADGG